MILLDTNILVDALDKDQAHHSWSKKQIEEAVVGEGGGINVVTLSELCAGAREPERVEARKSGAWESACMTCRRQPVRHAARLIGVM